MVGPLISAISTEIGSLSPIEAQALADDFFGVVGDAGAVALGAADAAFDPSVTLRGALQPLILGFPLGDPDTSFEVLIDPDSLGFTLTTSIIEQLESQAGLLTGTGAFAESLITAFTLGARDDLTVGVQLPLPGLSDVLVSGGEFPLLSMDDPNWSVTLAGAFSQFGMRAEVNGFITSAGNNAFVDARVERRYDSDGTVPPDPARIQFTRKQDYDNLLRYGGLVLDGRLEVPRLLTDPVGVVEDLPPIPEDLADSIPWFDQFGGAITETETPVRLTAFIPGLGEVIDEPSEAALEEWAGAISVTGVFEGTRRNPGEPAVARLLSLPIGEGRLLATTSGLEVTAAVPLIGVDGTFVLRVDEREGVRVPVGGVELAMQSDELQVALEGLGLPPVFDVAGIDAQAGFRAFTPGFDPASSDPLRRRGGLAVRARVDAEGFVDDALLDVVIDPVGTGSGPDFRAETSVAQLGPFGGVAITGASLVVEKAGPAVTVDVRGRATVAGSTWDVEGRLNPDLTGQLVLLGSGGRLPEFSGFRFVEGGLALSITRAAGVLVGSVGIAGRVALPDWLAGRSSSTVAASGCVGTNGSAEFRLALGRINLDPAGTAALVGTGAALAIDPNAVCTLPPNVLGMSNSDARLVVRVANSTTTVAVDGAVAIAGGGLPLLRATGSLSTTGTGSLAVNFDSGGLDLGGFRIRGGATLRLLAANQFDLAVDGQVTIPGVVTDARVTGAVTAQGVQRLAISTTGLALAPITVTSSSLELVRVGAGYRVDAALAGARRGGAACRHHRHDPRRRRLDPAEWRLLPVSRRHGLHHRRCPRRRLAVAHQDRLDDRAHRRRPLRTVGQHARRRRRLDDRHERNRRQPDPQLTGRCPLRQFLARWNAAHHLQRRHHQHSVDPVAERHRDDPRSRHLQRHGIAVDQRHRVDLGVDSVGHPHRRGGVATRGRRLVPTRVRRACGDVRRHERRSRYRSGTTVVFRSVIPSFSISSTELFPIVRDISLPDLDVGTFFQADGASFRLTIEATSAASNSARSRATTRWFRCSEAAPTCGCGRC